MNGRIFYRQTAVAIAHYWQQELNISPNVHYRIREAINGPRLIVLHVIVNPRYATKIMAMSEALSMAAGLDKEQTIRIARGRSGALSVEIPKPGGIGENGVPTGLWYNVSITALPRRVGLRATVGLDTEHRPTLVDFSDPLTPHALIAGCTGSGKTNCQRLVVYDLASQNAPNHVQFLLIDTKKRGIGWRPFERLPHLLHSIITDDLTALKALGWAVAEIDRRAKSGQTRPRVFVGIDEAQALLEQRDFIKPIGDLAGVGREFGIHLLAALQDPTKDNLGDTTIKRNLTVRLVGKTDSPDAAKVAAGIGGTGAERLIGAGDFLLVQPDGVRRLTTALLTRKDVARLPTAERVGYLDLAEYEDIDHVLSQADNQSKADPLEPAHVAYALVYPEASQRELNREFSIGFPKIRRVQAFAQDVLAELEKLGFSICNGATVQRLGE
ncbi:MAG: FtsK/SpoIIIE domain-containing protein [Anaerolineae bacterium]